MFVQPAQYEMRHFGANVSADRLVAAVREDPPHLLGLSVTITFDLESLRRAVDRLRSAVGETATQVSSAVQVRIEDTGVGVSVRH